MFDRQSSTAINLTQSVRTCATKQKSKKKRSTKAAGTELVEDVTSSQLSADSQQPHEQELEGAQVVNIGRKD